MVDKMKDTDHFDEYWKEILDYYLFWFMKLFFSEIHNDIDWKRGYDSLEKELYKIVPKAEVGKRFVDKLFQVYLKNGDEACVYIHIEFQVQKDLDFPERIYIYHSRIFLRYKRPVCSLAVLGDDQPNWKPVKYEHKVWNCRMTLEFQTVKLLEFKDRIEELKKSGNPFAFFVIAHLKTLETKKNPKERLGYKEEITKEMFEQGFSQQDIYRLFQFIDGLMSLPDDLEQEYLDTIHAYEEENEMPILAPFERIAIEKGREEGIQIGSLNEAQDTVIELLTDQFGELPTDMIETVQSIEDITLLRKIRRQICKLDSLEEFHRLINEDTKYRRDTK